MKVQQALIQKINNKQENNMTKYFLTLCAAVCISSMALADNKLSLIIEKDYDENLQDLFRYFHKNPELSLQEHNTSARLDK